MFKKCKANCQANDNLYLRGNVFYYMVELPRQDGKRRYFIKSLHTKDYYEALERLKLMKDDSYSKTIEAKTLIFAAESISKTILKLMNRPKKLSFPEKTLNKHKLGQIWESANTELQKR